MLRTSNTTRRNTKHHQNGAIQGVAPQTSKKKPVSIQTSTPTSSCSFCGTTTHRTGFCSKEMTIKAKRNIIKREKLCYACLKRWTREHKCGFKCTTCGKRHHDTLCYSTGGRLSRGRLPIRYRPYPRSPPLRTRDQCQARSWTRSPRRKSRPWPPNHTSRPHTSDSGTDGGQPSVSQSTVMSTDNQRQRCNQIQRRITNHTRHITSKGKE